MNITFIDSIPSGCTKIDSFLRNKGFSREEEETTDCLRWWYYYKQFSSNAIIRIVLRFELCLSDGLNASYDENHDLLFNDAYMEVFDRQMQEDEEGGMFYGDKMYNEEIESVRRIDSIAINPRTFEDVDSLISILT